MREILELCEQHQVTANDLVEFAGQYIQTRTTDQLHRLRQRQKRTQINRKAIATRWNKYRGFLEGHKTKQEQVRDKASAVPSLSVNNPKMAEAEFVPHDGENESLEQELFG